MVSLERVAIWIFTIIGFIIIIGIAYYIVNRFWYQERAGRQQPYPPTDYMVMDGAQCPNLWDIESQTGADVVCRNTFNLPIVKSDVKDKPYCQNVDCNRERVKFGAINQYPLRRNDPRIRQRCQWRDCCGINKNMPSAWIGLDDVCS